MASKRENKDVFLNLEVKSTPFKMGLTPIPSDTVSLILKDIDTYKLEDRIIISSFDWRILYELKKQNPKILRGFLSLQQDLSTLKKTIYEDSPWMGKKFPSEDLFLLPKIIKSLEGHVWCPFYKDVTKKNVDLAHELGLAVNVWTVSKESDIVRMIEYGVDGIITDYPKKLKTYACQEIFLGSKTCKKVKFSIKKFDEKKISKKLVRKKIRRIQSYNGVIRTILPFIILILQIYIIRK